MSVVDRIFNKINKHPIAITLTLLSAILGIVGFFSFQSGQVQKAQVQNSTGSNVIQNSPGAIQAGRDLIIDKSTKPPAPQKATLMFTFGNPHRIDEPTIREVTLPVKENVVHVEFAMKNETDVTAENGEMIFGVCAECKFASEPPLFSKNPGGAETRRNYAFDHLFARSVSVFSADVQVPPHLASIEVGVTYRCLNCVVQETPLRGAVFLSR